MARFPGFIGGSHPTQSPLAGAERTVNLYVEPIQREDAPGQKMLLPAPGFKPYLQVTDVAARGFTLAGSRWFGVIGGGVYEFDSVAVATKRGTVAQDSNPAQFAYNGIVGGQLGIVSGGTVYYLDLTTNVVTATTLTGGYTHLAYAGGYGLAFNPTTGKVNISNLNNLAVWDAGTFYQRSLFADPYQAMFVDGNNLVWMVGTETYEVRYNDGQSTQPFVPLSGVQGRHGIAAPFAYGLAGDSLVWLDRHAAGAGAIIAVRGSQAQAVSTFAVDTQTTAYQRTSVITDAELLVYQEAGHTFVNVSIPRVPATWTYDLDVQSWSERGTWNAPANRYDLWAPRVHCFAYGKHYVGDRTTGIVAEMSTAFSTELDGVTGIRRQRVAPIIQQERKRTPIDQIELHMDTGEARTIGQGSNPIVMARFSSDGRTWGNERQAGTGRQGQYGTRVYWTQLGASALTAMDVTWSEPVPLRIVDAYVNNLERVA